MSLSASYIQRGRAERRRSLLHDYSAQFGRIADRFAAEAALRLVVGQRSIDDVLVRDREGVEEDTRRRLQEILDGYDTGIISGALLQITKDFGIAEGWKQLIAASILLGAVIGALVCSYLSNKRGRRGTLLMLGVLFVVGALWCAVSPNPELLSLGRLVLGFAVGGATQTAPMYVAELAPPKYRGRLVLCFQIAIAFRWNPSRA